MEVLKETVTDQKRILLVDDDPAVRRLTNRMLGMMGYEVIEAENGREAMDLFTNDPSFSVDVVLTDFKMPEMGGDELLINLRSSHPDLKAVFISGMDKDSVDVPDEVRNATTFIQKPFTRDILQSTVQEILNG